jgi:branched-chain amino acid transport system permease protein
MSRSKRAITFASLLSIAGLAALPLFAGAYWVAFLVNMLMYAALAMAWSLFSGPTRYVSLATAAFFGLGAYVAAMLAGDLSWPLVLASAVVSGAGVSLIVGLATLRLSGVYFVIFSFGLAEFIREVVSWSEATFAGSVGRSVSAEFSTNQIYWQLLFVCILVVAIAVAIDRSRLGWALKAIGEDEVVARHMGIDTTRVKVFGFVVSATLMALVGAIIAPRWTYLDPSIAFAPVVSFQVLVMSLFGGTRRLLGPIMGVVPLVTLFEVLQANLPNHYSILLGGVFLLVVYFVPNGVSDLVKHWPSFQALTVSDVKPAE